MSLSARRAWIEICGGACARRLALLSLSARRAWIEIASGTLSDTSDVSLSARRAWIEIFLWVLTGGLNLSLSARRAWIEILYKLDINRTAKVALRKESVDRNSIALASIKVSIVALRKESVDRNLGCDYPFKLFKRSLSARRAWIEISLLGLVFVWFVSLSARRAWIEIVKGISSGRAETVALRKESVDRNRQREIVKFVGWRRSPQGERG